MKPFVAALTALILGSTTAQANYIDKTIPLSAPPGQVIVNGGIFVANGDQVSVFDGRIFNHVYDVPVPGAYALAFDPLDRLLTYASGKLNGVSQVYQFDENKLLTVGTVTSTPGAGITALAVNPVNEDLYVANASDQEVDIVSYPQEAFEVIERIPMPAEPTGIATSALNGLAYISLANGQVVTIGLKTQKIVSTIQAGTSLSGIVVDPNGEGRVYALDTDAVVALDPTATIIRRTIAVPAGPLGGVAFAGVSPLGDGRHEIFITGPNGTTAIDGTTYQIIHTIPQEAGSSVGSDSFFNKVIVSSSTANELLVIEK